MSYRRPVTDELYSIDTTILQSIVLSASDVCPTSCRRPMTDGGMQHWQDTYSQIYNVSNVNFLSLFVCLV